MDTIEPDRCDVLEHDPLILYVSQRHWCQCLCVSSINLALFSSDLTAISLNEIKLSTFPILKYGAVIIMQNITMHGNFFPYL